MKAGFLDKLIARLDRLEPGEVQNYLARLVQEKGVFEKVFEALEEGVIVLDAESRITFINGSACRLLGLDREKALESALGDRVPGIDPARLGLAGGGSLSRDLEVTFPEHRYLNFYLAPLADPGNEDGDVRERPLGYVMLIRDVTQTRRLTQEMIESERLSALTMLAAGVAHELGNPLNSLTIHLQLLDRKLRKASPDLHGQLGELLEISQGEIKRLDFIIRQFLHAIRPTTPNLERADLNTLLAESLKLLAPELEDRAIETKLALSPDVPPLMLDPGQIKQAFYNLIKNAYQAMGTGGRLAITTARDRQEVTVAFEDTGEGIPPEVMSGLFQPYFTTKKSGTGLGLLIVRRIVREHGGEISIRSDPGRGTTTTIHLPVERPGIRMLEESATTTKAATVDTDAPARERNQGGPRRPRKRKPHETVIDV